MLLFTATLIPYSCSEDNSSEIIDSMPEIGDISTENPDPIVGTWTLESIVTDSGLIFVLSNCRKLSNRRFEADGQFISTVFSGGLLNIECTSPGPQIGTWENNEDGTYTITEEGEAPTKVNITFEDNTVIFREINEGGVVSDLRETFIKVE